MTSANDRRARRACRSRHINYGLLFLLVLSGTAVAETVERKAAADRKGEVEIINIAGTVEVRGWDRAEVQVRAELASADRLEFRTEGSRTLVKVVVPSGRKSSGSADVVVDVPLDCTVSINTVSADQRVEKVRGIQRLQAVSGNIETSVWSEEFRIKTISGDVQVQGHKARTLGAVNSVSGDIDLKDVSGEVELETVTGDMEVRMDELTRGRLHTTNGNLNLQTRLAPDARLDAEAINGDLSFRFRGKLAAEFDVETFNGDIDNCFGPEAVRTREFAPGRALRFKQGDGGARVRIKTLNGGVELCKD